MSWLYSQALVGAQLCAMRGVENSACVAILFMRIISALKRDGEERERCVQTG